MLQKFAAVSEPDFEIIEFLKEKDLSSDVIHYTYLWRSANAILKQIDQPILNKKLIDIWLFCVEHFFWKANHFCWNLNQYGPNEYIKNQLQQLLPKFIDFEWVQYQILSNLASNNQFSKSELKTFFRTVKEQSSSFVRLGYYLVLVQHVQPQHQLFTALRQAIKNEQEPYVREYIFNLLSRSLTNKDIEEIQFWFGV